MWKHVESVHDGIIGPDNGVHDFQMIKRETWTQPLHRLTAEGLDIKDLEDQEHVGMAVCLNSKED